MKTLKVFVILFLITVLSMDIAMADPPINSDRPEGMTFVNIPAGTFEMGDHFGTGEEHERPVHTVSVNAFRLSKYEVTNAQYAEYLNSAMAEGLIKVTDGVVFTSTDDMDQPYFHTSNVRKISQILFSNGTFTVRSRNGFNMADHPVVAITWFGAKAFCDYYGYRLPTEAEWEYAARGGFHSPYCMYPWGSNSIDLNQTNYNGANPLGLDNPKTTPVGFYPEYGYGLCDMAGNVIEWCHDWWDENYYAGSLQKDPKGPSNGATRVLRGGCWFLTADFSRVTSRGTRAADWSCPAGVNGFRPAMDIATELIAHWALDEEEGIVAEDSAGGSDAYLIGDPIWQPADGIVDGAILLDGVDDCAVTMFFPNLAGWPFSIVAWIKGGAPGQVVLSQIDTANWICTDQTGGVLMTELKSADQYGSLLTSEAIITDGYWHQIGVIWDGSYRTLYVDGVVVAKDTQNDLEISDNDLYFGTGKIMEPGTFFTGLIDDIRIYSRSLNAEEIAELAK